MSKRLLIISTVFIPGETPDAPATPVYPGTVQDFDDGTAGNLIASGRARIAKEGAKRVDTTREHEEAAAERVTATPESQLAGVIAQAAAAAVSAVMDRRDAQIAEAAGKAVDKATSGA